MVSSGGKKGKASKKEDVEWLAASSDEEGTNYEPSMLGDTRTIPEEEMEADEEDMFSELREKYSGIPYLQATIDAAYSMIRANGVEISPVALFGVFISYFATEGVTEKPADEIGCVLAVLEVVLENLPVAILQSKFSMLSPALLSIYETFASSALVVKHLIGCMFVLIAPQPAPVWSNADGLSSLQLMLSLSVDNREKVRKAAQTRIIRLYFECDPKVIKVITNSLAHFYKRILQQANSQNATVVVHILRVLRHILPRLPTTFATQFMEDILKLPGVGNASVTAAAFHCLAVAMEIPTDDDVISNITPEQVKAVFEVLPTVQPNATEELPLATYIDLLGQICKRLYRSDKDLCVKSLPKIFQILIGTLKSEKKAVIQATKYTLQLLVRQCISNEMIQEAVDTSSGPLVDIVGYVEQAFSAQYQQSLDVVLSIIASLFERLDVHSAEIMKSVLLSVSEHYHNMTQTHLEYPLNAALGFAISSMGPRKFLEILPLNLDQPIRDQHEFDDPNPNRVWLLPALRDNIECAEIKFFVEYFIPLANNIQNIAKRNEDMGRLVEAKNSQIIFDQIWSLFPGFCNKSSDTVEYFKNIAKIIGQNLADSEVLRHHLVKGLRTLIESNKAVAHKDDDVEKDDDDVDGADKDGKPALKLTVERAKASLKTVGSFSKNFMPILFNLFTTPDIKQHIRYQILQLIESYVSITDAQLLNNFFKNVMAKLLEATTKKAEMSPVDIKHQKEQSYLLTELLVGFVKELTTENLEILFKAISPSIKSSDRILQKKSYKVLHKIAATHHDFVNANRKKIDKLLVDSTNSAHISSKTMRIKIISVLLATSDSDDIPAQYLAEIILGVKNKDKKVAFNILIDFSNAYIAEYPEEGITRVMTEVAAGLAGKPPMVACTIYALARLLFEYNETMDQEFMGEMIGAIFVLLQSPNHEIIRAVFNFLKVAVIAVPVPVMKEHLKEISSSLGNWMISNKNKFRMLVRDIVIRMFKKYGYALIYNLMPTPMRAYMSSIRKKELKDKKEKATGEKQKKKEARQKKKEEIEVPSDSDDDDMWGLEEKKVPKSDDLYILQDEDNILDLTDPRSTMQNIVSSKPKNAPVGTPSKAKREYFKQLEDGRFVFDENTFMGEEDGDESGDDETVLTAKQRALMKSNAKLPIDPRMVMDEEEALDKLVQARGKKNLTREDYLASVLELKEEAEDSDDDNKKKPNNYENSSYAERNRKKRGFSKIEEKTELPGAKFKSRGGGDTGKGRHDPFAYIPLDPKLLNKRKNKRVVKTIQAVVPGHQKRAHKKAKNS